MNNPYPNFHVDKKELLDMAKYDIPYLHEAVEKERMFIDEMRIKSDKRLMDLEERIKELETFIEEQEKEV